MVQIYVAGKVRGRKWEVIPKHPLIKYVASDGDDHSEHLWGHSCWSFRDSDVRRNLAERCIEPLEASEVIFAYLDTPDSFGSIAEIAYASALGIGSLVAVNTSSDAAKFLDMRAKWESETHSEDEYYYEPIAGDMQDAYWFVCNFPNVIGIEVSSEDDARAFFEINYAQFLVESEVERAFWNAFSKPRSRESYLPVPQFEIDKYRLDFAWPNFRVAVEIDGHDYHKTKEQRSYDAKRDRDLLKLGWTTLRFTGSDVFRDADAVAAEVASILVQVPNHA